MRLTRPSIVIVVPLKGVDRMNEKKREVKKLYVGHRARRLLEELTRSLLVEDGISKLTSTEREEYQTSLVERGTTAAEAVMEIALLSMLARVSDRWPGGEEPGSEGT